MKRKTIRVALPILPADKIGGLHTDVATAEFPDGMKAVVSAGFGLGHTQMYVSLGGRRVLSVDAGPLLRGLIDAAVDRERKERE